jgi:hypothetical protein
MSFIQDKMFFADAGYSSTVVPKSGSLYSSDERRMVKQECYSFDQMKASEREFVRFSKMVKRAGIDGVLGVRQVKAGDRAAVVYFHGKDADYYVNNFLTFHLQKGVIYNVPVNRMRNLTGKQLTRMRHDDFSVGLKSKQFFNVMNKYLSYVGKQCDAVGVGFSNDIKHLALLGLNNKFVFDFKVWKEFLDFGLSPLEVAFGLSKELNPRWQAGELNVSPDLVRGFMDVPDEWVRRMLID